MLLTHNTKSIKQVYNRRNTRAVRDREAAQLFSSQLSTCPQPCAHLLLLPLLPRGLRVLVPEVRQHELGERARVLVGPRPRAPNVLGQRREARHGPHGTTKTAAALTRRADQATARASATSEFTGPRCGCGSRAAVRDRRRSVLAICHLELQNLYLDSASIRKTWTDCSSTGSQAR